MLPNDVLQQIWMQYFKTHVLRELNERFTVSQRMSDDSLSWVLLDFIRLRDMYKIMTGVYSDEYKVRRLLEHVDVAHNIRMYNDLMKEIEETGNVHIYRFVKNHYTRL